MEDDKLVRLLLHPVEMGRQSNKEATLVRSVGSGEHSLTEGRPMLAKGEDAVRIIERYRRLSAPLGTEIVIRDGVGIIEIAA
jgi:poly-gamma-glutamate synthesis protein (capsule biosynthesis protein)